VIAKLIIATNTSDIPEILDEYGWIVEPENLKRLAQKKFKIILGIPMLLKRI